MAEEARRRAEFLDGWAHPERHVPLVLPESLPAAVPPVQDFYEQVLEVVTGG